MTATVPPAIDALPAAPDPNDRASFNARAYPWAAAQAVLATQVSAVATNVYDNAVIAGQASAKSDEAIASAASALISADSAQSAWASIDDLYLGKKAIPPTTNNHGAALVVGALYFSTALNGMRVWSGTEWEPAYLPDAAYQELLVPGTNIKTINNESPLGSGDIAVGYREIPQNIQSADYTLTLLDVGKHIIHPSSDTTARTYTIPANVAVAFKKGSATTFVNQAGAGVITVAITSDVMRQAGTGTTGSRTLAANNIATALKVDVTEWIFSGGA